MKNRKLSKICLLTIALAMLITAIVGISVHADDAPEAPKIVSKNVSYEGALHLYYAIPVTDAVTADNTVVNVYKTNPDTDASAELIGTYSGEAEYIEVLGGNFIVVRTGGVPAKNIADYAYAQPVSGGVVGNVVRYSVAEYLYERLYVADNCTPVQRNLYNSTLQYGIDAQAALAPDATNKITDYNYVYAKDATIDAEGNFSGLYLDGETLTLTCTAEGILEGWKLKTLGDNGEFAESTQTSNTLTVNATTIISPDIFVRENKGETFDKAFKDSAYENVLLPNAADYKYSDSIYANKGTSAEHAQVMFGVVEDPTDATNRVLRLTKDSTTSTNFSNNLYVTAPSTTTFDTFVFESDFYFDYYDKTGKWDKVMQIDLMNGSTIGASILLSPLGDGGNNETDIAVRVLNADSTSPTIYESVNGVKAECSWFNVRVEYQILDAATSSTETRVYINGTLVKTVNYVNNATPQLNITRANVHTGYPMCGEFYMDNVVCQKVVYADESRPVYDFTDDELPAGVTLTGDFKVNKGQLVASTTIGSVDTATFAPTETEEGEFNTVVWSADINGTPTANQNGDFSEIAFYDESGKCFTFHIMFRNSVGAGIYFRAVTYGCEAATDTSTQPKAGTEFNLRLEYYLVEGAANVDVYVNGIFTGTITDVNQPNVATDGTKVDFKLAAGDSQDVTLDNVRLYKINKDR